MFTITLPMLYCFNEIFTNIGIFNTEVEKNIINNTAIHLTASILTIHDNTIYKVCTICNNKKTDRNISIIILIKYTVTIDCVTLK